MFSWLQRQGGLSEEEMSRTFNCGLGAVLVVTKQDAQRVLRLVQAQEEAWIVGSLAHKQPGELTKCLLSETYVDYEIIYLEIFLSYLCILIILSVFLLKNSQVLYN